MKSSLILFAALVLLLQLVAAKFEFTEEWELWKKVRCYFGMSRHSINYAWQENEKEYSTDEEELQRHMIWEANKNYVDNHNEHADVFGFTLAMNQLADLVFSLASYISMQVFLKL